MNVYQRYKHIVKMHAYETDAAQETAVLNLQTVYEEWVNFEKQRSSYFKYFINFFYRNMPRSVYIWGGVGRGKSFLMDCFYSVVPIVRKTRLHFYEFMRDIYFELNELRSIINPLEVISNHIAAKYQLICFDEFYLSNIADLVILHNLFKSLFKNNVSFVITSNAYPEDLYPNSIDREKLLSFINFLKTHLYMINIDSGIDYRRMHHLEIIENFYIPHNSKSYDILNKIFTKEANTPDENPYFYINVRPILAVRRAGRIIWFDFLTLCGNSCSHIDYLKIASSFKTIILSSVPKMSSAMSSEAQRFIWLIDVLYDYRVKLILSAEVNPEILYSQGPIKYEFERAISRLIEMQTYKYINTQHRILMK